MNCLLETGYILGFTPPHYCRVGFLCLVLYTVRSRPPPPPPPPPCQTQSFTQQLCHAESFTHTLSLSLPHNNFVIHNLSHTHAHSFTQKHCHTQSFTHKNFVTRNLSHNGFVTQWYRHLLCVAGVALGDIDLRLAWQAWRLWRWVRSVAASRPWRRGTLRGRCGTCGTGPCYTCTIPDFFGNNHVSWRNGVNFANRQLLTLANWMDLARLGTGRVPSFARLCKKLLQ